MSIIKKLILIIFIMFLGLRGEVFAQSQFSPVITKMENSLFGIEYSSQNDDTRLNRIEERVYGAKSSKTISQRIAKLKDDLAADLMGQEIKPTKDTFTDESDNIKEDIPKEDNSVNYPIVNMLEDKVFNKEYKNMGINQRLANLEQKTFNKVYSDDLNSRVERLKMSISPQNIIAQDDYETSTELPEYFEDELPSLKSYTPSAAAPLSYSDYDYNSQNSVLDNYKSSADIGIPLSAIEKSLFKKVYADDTPNSRLSRLETRIFNSTFSEDDPQTRVERISSAHRAKKSSKKYDNNKFTQNMSAAMQIGAVLLMILAAVL